MRADTLPEPMATDRLHQLEEEVLALGTLVEGVLIEAADLVHNSDMEVFERLGDKGRQVHKKRLAIEMGCLNLISGRPVSGELWHLVAIVEIAAELERLSDHARQVIQTNYLVVDPDLCTVLASLADMATRVQALLDGALVALARHDASAAQYVAAGSREADALYQQVRHDLLLVIKGKPRLANQAIFLSRSAHNLRRAAKRVNGICEWVVFTVEGSPGTNETTPTALSQPLDDAFVTL